MPRPSHFRFYLSFSLLTLALALLLGACGSAPEPTPTPTRTPVIETPTPEVTATPTATVPPTETPTITPTPTATPNPNLIDPRADSGISPFTGLPISPEVAARRPELIKVANDDIAQKVQSGLSNADIVVESRVEYNLTRYSALFHSQEDERVGPIRSVRLIDRDLPVIFDAVLAFSGGVQPVREMLYDSDLSDQIIEQALNGPSFYRDTSIKHWNNLFTDTATLRRLIERKGWNTPPQPTLQTVFSETPPDGGQPASAQRILYPIHRVRWDYDSASGRWLRTLAGNPHLDSVTGEQYSAANVIDLGINHAITLIVENGTERQGDPCINCSVEVQIWGEGPVKIFRDGQVYEGKWVRPERFGPFRFVDANGVDIPLKPGNSWWQVTPLDTEITIEP